MKTKLIYLLMTLPFLCACEKETINYEGKEGLYFDVQWGVSWLEPSTWAHQFYTLVDFGKTGGEETDLSLTVRATGELKNYDRPFQVYVVQDSTTAIEGEEYEFLNQEYAIKAGETSVNIPLKIKKTERMTQKTVKVQLAILPGDYFELPFTTYGATNVPGRYDADENPEYSCNHDPRIHNIYANDFLTKPSPWFVVWGTYSEKKYRLMMEISGTTPDEYTQDLMPSQRANMIAEMVAKYLLAEKEKGTPVLEEDGTVMYIKGVSWSEGITPDQL